MIHDQANTIAERYRIVLRACIVAAALSVGCGILHREDTNDGQDFGGDLTIKFSIFDSH